LTGTPPTKKKKKPPRSPGHSPLQRTRAHGEGTRIVTEPGRGEVVVSAQDFHRLEGDRSGEALIAAMQASPCRDIDIVPEGVRAPVRGIDV
jgi:hypothetical protein